MRVESDVVLQVTSGGKSFRLEPGVPMDLPDPVVRALRTKVGERIRLVSGPVPTEAQIQAWQNKLYAAFPPFPVGSLVTYRDSQEMLRGGCEDPRNGHVDAVAFENNQWVFTLSNGLRLRGNQVTGVTLINSEAKQPTAAWLTGQSGLSGDKHRYVSITGKPTSANSPQATWTGRCRQCGSDRPLIFWHKLEHWLCSICRLITDRTCIELEPSVSSASLTAASLPRYRVGQPIVFDAHLGRLEQGMIQELATWFWFPGQHCYLIGSRTIPECWVKGLAD